MARGFLLFVFVMSPQLGFPGITRKRAVISYANLGKGEKEGERYKTS